ncbi:MAG: SUMF1/EgtB/PvdO family nonheme iron enzyme, partial [Spirochaetota bacterium]
MLNNKMLYLNLLIVLFFTSISFISSNEIDIVSIFKIVEGGNYKFSLNGVNYKIPDLYVQKSEFSNRQLVEILNWALKQGYIEVVKNEVYEIYQGRFLIYLLEEKYSGLVFSKNEFSVKKNFENLPASYISWYGALTICNFLSMMQGFVPCYNLINAEPTPNGNGFRLPYSYEWEYCAIGGKKSQNFKYSGSNDLNEVGWFNKNSSKSPQMIMMKKPNELGLYDMSGNLYEWCFEMSTSAGVYARGGDFNSNESQCLPTSFSEFDPLDCLINVG